MTVWILRLRIKKDYDDITFIGGIGMQEVLLIALVEPLFIGGKKIP